MSHPYVVSILENKLIQEKKDLKMWEEIVNSSTDETKIKQANGNIPSTLHRIGELEICINLIKVNK